MIFVPNPTTTLLGVGFKQFKSSYSLSLVFDLKRICHSDLRFNSVTKKNIMIASNC